MAASPREREVADPLLRYLSYSTPRLMHNLLRAFNNASLTAARRALVSSSTRVPTNRSSACCTLIFHECFDVCFVSIRCKGESATIKSGRKKGRKEGRRGFACPVSPLPSVFSLSFSRLYDESRSQALSIR